MNGYWDLVQSRSPELLKRLTEHVQLAGLATLIAIVIGILMGVLSLRSSVARHVLLNSASILQTIPSLALLTFLLPFLGIGTTPAIVALVLYALLPIARNTYTGLSSTPPAMLDMADALGMTRFQRLWMIESRFAASFVLAGIRTAATVSIGIATLSAFVGAGGLGTFINRGLALNNMNLVLLGAIPAGLLALYTDWLLSVLENGIKPRIAKKTLIIQGGAATAVGALAIGSLWVSAERHRETKNIVSTRPPIVVGSKNFSEQLILGEILAQALESSTDLKIIRKFNLAGTAVCHQALVSGQIDLYPEYTGTALVSVLKVTAPTDSDLAWRTASERYSTQFDLTWLRPLGFANTYALAVRKDDAIRKGWKRVSDLKRNAASLTAGFTSEFLERGDGYPGLAKRYGFKFDSAIDMDPGLMYQAVRDGKVDVISAFSTDGRIAAYSLLLLEDDRRFFPPYDAAVVVRNQIIEAHPEVSEVLGRLAGQLDEKTMQQLNLAVDRDGKLPYDVARQFLADSGWQR